MRQKAFYTKDEIITNLYTTGEEWMIEDSMEYKGLYHTYATGETYTAGTWTPGTSVKLIPYEFVQPDALAYKKLTNIEVKFDSIKPSAVTITQQNLEDGYVTRYFIKKINESSISEIDKTQYDAWVSKKIDNNLYVAVEVFWKIAGNRNTELVRGVQLPGVVEVNLENISRANQIVPGISSKLTNLLQYYSDTDITVPRDINA
jgi:hypothetical protein